MNYFGQQPLAALKPLLSGQNLSDVADKALGRTNLEVFSRDETMLHSVPIGTIISFWGSTAPVGYLPCFGQTINSGTFPDLVEFLNPGQPSATVPELRGEFLRGWDNGRGIDLGRAVNTFQDQDTKTKLPANAVSVLYGVSSGGTVQIGTAGTYINLQIPPIGETRPRNVSVLYCIKAYGAVINESTVDIGNVLTDLSTAVRTTQFESSLGVNGYQKLPSGLILQWGQITGSYNVTTFNFPLAFPTACVSCGVMSVKGDVTGNAEYVQVWDATPTSVKAVTYTDVAPGNVLGAITFGWLAIGY